MMVYLITKAYILFLKSFIKYMVRFIKRHYTSQKIYFICFKVKMFDVITFVDKFLRTDTFMCTLKAGLPELTPGRQFMAPVKGRPIKMSKFIRNTLKSVPIFLSCSNF